MPLSAAHVLVAMLELPHYVADRHEPESVRAELLRPYAEEVSFQARTPEEAARVIAAGQHESGFARYVLEGRCAEGPPGQRCDDGKARGFAQLHLAACRDAHAQPVNTRLSIALEVRCVFRQLRAAEQRCAGRALTPLHGAFAGYAGRPCNWRGADARVKTARRVLEALRRPLPEPEHVPCPELEPLKLPEQFAGAR